MKKRECWFWFPQFHFWWYYIGRLLIVVGRGVALNLNWTEDEMKLIEWNSNIRFNVHYIIIASVSWNAMRLVSIKFLFHFLCFFKLWFWRTEYIWNPWIGLACQFIWLSNPTWNDQIIKSAVLWISLRVMSSFIYLILVRKDVWRMITRYQSSILSYLIRFSSFLRIGRWTNSTWKFLRID